MPLKPWRVPADDDYLLLVGRVTYTFAYLEWAIIWLMRELEPTLSLDTLAALTARRISRMFVELVEQLPADEIEARRIARAFADLVAVRDDVVHAHPATTTDGAQRLYRWSPKRGAQTRWVDPDMLAAFIRDMEELAIAAGAVLHARRRQE